MSHPTDLTTMFDANVPAAVQAALVGIVRVSHEAATRFCESEFAEPESRYLKPHLKRSFVERGLSLLPARFSELSVITDFNRSGDAHRILHCAQVRLTASYLGPREGMIPRAASFRGTLASNLNQLLLSPEADSIRLREVEAARRGIYTLLCHRAADDRGVTDVSIVFVDEACNYLSSLDLLARTRSTSAEIEQVQDDVQAELRSDLARRLRETSQGA